MFFVNTIIIIIKIFLLFFVKTLPLHFQYTYFCYFRSHTVLLGVHNSQNSDEIQTISVQQVFPHTNYNATSFKDDIMLLKVKTNVSNFVKSTFFIFTFSSCCVEVPYRSLQILHCLFSYHPVHFLLDMNSI